MRVGTAAVAMVLVAEAAVWLLRPRDRPIHPAPVSESDYFTPAQLDRGRTFSDGQLWLFLAVLGAEGNQEFFLAGEYSSPSERKE